MYRNRYSQFVPLVLTALVSGCGAAEDVTETDDVGTADAPVVNGTLTTEPNWVVAIVTNFGTSAASLCSAWVLNEHWLLTAAHCVKDVANGAVVQVSRATGLGTAVELYRAPARYFAHPLFADSAPHDVGLIHLDNAGLRIDLTGIARMYSDTRRPWADRSLPRDISTVGWGLVTPDPNDPTNCIRSPNLLRTTVGMTVDVSSATTSFVTSPIGATFPCSGDSGAPWLLLRGDSTAGFAQMGFAVHSRRAGSPRKAQAPTIDDNRAFIENTVGSLNSTDVYGTFCSEQSLGGFRFRTCQQTGRGWGQLRSSFGTCLQATDSASGSAVTLATCNQTVSAQVWALFPSGEIKNLLNTTNCLEANASADGTPLRVASCNGNSTQRFGNGPQGQLTLGAAFGQCVTAMADPVIAPSVAKVAVSLDSTAIKGLPCTSIYCMPRVQVQTCSGGGGRNWSWGTV